MSTIAPPQVPDQIEVPEEVAHRIRRYIDAAKIAHCTDFPGLVLMSLSYMVDDDTWEQALQSALETVVDLGEKKGVGNA